LTVVEKFEKFLRVQGLSEKTITTYSFFVKRFCESLETDPENATIDDITDFLANIENNNSRNIAIWALRKLYEYAGNLGLMKPFKSTFTRKEVSYWLKPEEVKKMVDLAYRPRDKAIIWLTYIAALRVGEIPLLKKSDIEWENKTLRVTIEKRKTPAHRTVPLDHLSLKLLKEYLEKEKPKGEQLFPQAKKSNNFQKLIRKHLKLINAKTTRSHVLRHSRAAFLRNEGIPLDTIKEFLGHAKLDTTLIYSAKGIDLTKEIPFPQV